MRSTCVFAFVSEYEQCIDITEQYGTDVSVNACSLRGLFVGRVCYVYTGTTCGHFCARNYLLWYTHVSSMTRVHRASFATTNVSPCMAVYGVVRLCTYGHAHTILHARSMRTLWRLEHRVGRKWAIVVNLQNDVEHCGSPAP